jgi:hypothetical protein
MKAPSTSHPRSVIELPAIPTPHQGTSYNPPAEAHQDLLRAAHAVEEEGMKGADKGRDVHERMTNARQLGGVTQEGLPPGMALHEVEEEEEEGTVIPLVKPAPARKTKQQRKKAQRVLEEVRPLANSLNWIQSFIHQYTTYRKGPQLRRQRNGNFWRRYSRPSRYGKPWSIQQPRKNNCVRKSGGFFGRNSNRAWRVRSLESTRSRRYRSTSSWVKISRTA